MVRKFVAISWDDLGWWNNPKPRHLLSEILYGLQVKITGIIKPVIFVVIEHPIALCLFLAYYSCIAWVPHWIKFPCKISSKTVVKSPGIKWRGEKREVEVDYSLNTIIEENSCMREIISILDVEGFRYLVGMLWIGMARMTIIAFFVGRYL